jgi:hypothetical protein
VKGKSTADVKTQGRFYFNLGQPLAENDQCLCYRVGQNTGEPPVTTKEVKANSAADEQGGNEVGSKVAEGSKPPMNRPRRN